MEWLDLVAPSAAILALFAVVGLVVVVIRQGRAIRRLEERLARTGDAAVEAPLQRIAELQARHQVSQGAPSLGRQLRVGGAIAVSALLLVAGAGGVWYLFARGDDAATPAARADDPATTAAPTGTEANPPEPVDTAVVPGTVAPLGDKSVYSVAVFNASGVTGAAAARAAMLENEGYSIATIGDSPDGATDRQESVVMWTKGNRRVAYNVAKDLGIERAPTIDGLTPAHLNGADVAVLIGHDIADAGTAAAP